MPQQQEPQQKYTATEKKMAMMADDGGLIGRITTYMRESYDDEGVVDIELFEGIPEGLEIVKNPDGSRFVLPLDVVNRAACGAVAKMEKPYRKGPRKRWDTSREVVKLGLPSLATMNNLRNVFLEARGMEELFGLMVGLGVNPDGAGVSVMLYGKPEPNKAMFPFHVDPPPYNQMICGTKRVTYMFHSMGNGKWAGIDGPVKVFELTLEAGEVLVMTSHFNRRWRHAVGRCDEDRVGIIVGFHALNASNQKDCQIRRDDSPAARERRRAKLAAKHAARKARFRHER